MRGRARPNPSFLDHRLFEAAFARPLEPYRDRVATLMFEFGTFSKAVFPNVRVFCEQLDSFLGALPAGFRYAVEIRNREYLVDDYFAVLARHRDGPRLQRVDANARDRRAGQAARLVYRRVRRRASLAAIRTYI